MSDTICPRCDGFGNTGVWRGIVDKCRHCEGTGRVTVTPGWRPYEPERRDVSRLDELLEALADVPDAVVPVEVPQAVVDALCESEGDEWFLDDACVGVPLKDIVAAGAKRFDERPRYRASIEAQRELDACNACDCWQIPDRHLDPDGHVPTCSESEAARYRREVEDDTAERIAAWLESDGDVLGRAIAAEIRSGAWRR